MSETRPEHTPAPDVSAQWSAILEIIEEAEPVLQDITVIAKVQPNNPYWLGNQSIKDDLGHPWTTPLYGLYLSLGEPPAAFYSKSPYQILALTQDERKRPRFVRITQSNRKDTIVTVLDVTPELIAGNPDILGLRSGDEIRKEMSRSVHAARNLLDLDPKALGNPALPFRDLDNPRQK